MAILLVLYSLVVLGGRLPSWALACFSGSCIAFVLPAHVVIAFLALVGVASVLIVHIARSLKATRRVPTISRIWRRTLLFGCLTVVATAIWGIQTGHGIGGGEGPATVSPFNSVWQESVVIVIVGAGIFLAIPISWFLTRRSASLERDLYLGTVALLIVGAFVWGARLSEFTMFYVFYAGIAVFATPIAAIAVWRLIERLRGTRHLMVAAALVAVCAIELELGAASGLYRLQQFGPGDYEPIAVSVLTAIKQLPPDAKLAYACQQFEEVAFTDPRLLSIDAHTGRRIVPMCFQADYFSTMIGAQVDLQLANASFAWAPQRSIYPDVAARPTAVEVAKFLKDHGIDYIYTDREHPNTLMADAVPIASGGGAEVLRVP